MNFEEFNEALHTPDGEEPLFTHIEQKNIKAIRKRLLIAMGLGVLIGSFITVFIEVVLKFLRFKGMI